MKTNTAVDAARLSLYGRSSLNRPTRKVGPPHASYPPSPNTNWPNATAAASNAISPRPASCQAKPSTLSSSRPCR